MTRYRNIRRWHPGWVNVAHLSGPVRVYDDGESDHQPRPFLGFGVRAEVEPLWEGED